MAWTPFTVAAPSGRSLPTDTVTYGPGIADDSVLRLIGDVEAKRVLDLGCGAGSHLIHLARRGARVIGVDPSGDQVGVARERAEDAGVRVEVHHAPVAELAFLRADSIDLALAVWSLARVEDLDRVFRQVHRVLHEHSPFVMALPHPVLAVTEPGGDDPLRIQRSAWDDDPLPGSDGLHVRLLSRLFAGLVRTGFSVDAVHEPRPPTSGSASPSRTEHWSPLMNLAPATLILRARKEGI